ncbi:MAG: 13E12 repeat family protein, partial [Actinomycetia bacterium]|nr:13E12 repeat family protein [Actinomycetes bacterium]
MFESQSYTGLRHMAEQVAAARETTGLATGVQACEALRQVQKTQDILDGVHADLLARVEESEAYTDEGASSTTSWARQQLRMSPGEAGRRRKAGNTLRTLPGVAAALGIGKIRAGHVDEFTGGITKLGADVMADVEELLLPIAESETPQVLREAISYLHEVLHPDDLDDKYAKGMERRDIKVAKCGQGWHLTGFLDQEVGAKFNEWLKTVSRPECEGDDRTPAGRRVDAFDRLLDTPDTPADTEPDADTSADADDADAEPATGTEADAETNAGTGADSETDV